MKIALFHGYSADNSGDALLVKKSLELVRDAVGDRAEITLFASYPEGFKSLGVRTYCSKPSWRGYDREYLRALRTAARDSNLIVGVGGGYLRAPGGLASFKSALVMGPQLWIAARSAAPSVYLPQSVGPFHGIIGHLIRRTARRVDRIFLRDDRSIEQLKSPTAARVPDLAIVFMRRTPRRSQVDRVPVINARSYRGELLPKRVGELGRALGTFDGVVQSSVAGNSDGPSVERLGCRQVIDRSKLYANAGPARVVVAMRLHCALESLNAGHYVIHLAYERKGFGAFADLGLSQYVHNVASFDIDLVRRQVALLTTSPDARMRYDAAVTNVVSRMAGCREDLLAEMNRLARLTGPE